MSFVISASAALKPRAAPCGHHVASLRAALPSAFRAIRLHEKSRVVATRAAGEDAGEEEAEDDQDAGEAAEILGDSLVQDEITTQLKYQTKLYQAQQFLETKKEEFLEKGEEGKSAMEEEAQLARDRASLELGMRASEIDEQLAEMLDETAAARARNEKVQAELAELEEQLTGRSSGGSERRRRRTPSARSSRRPSTRKPRTWTRA